eukprot:gene5874-7310_t
MPLKLENQSDLQVALKNFTNSGWVVLNYVGPSTIRFINSGYGEENVCSQVSQLLEDDQIQYGLMRFKVNEKGTLKTTMRDIFFTWIGPNVGIIEKGKKTANLGEVQYFLQPYHADITILNKNNFTTETVLDRSHPLSGSHNYSITEDHSNRSHGLVSLCCFNGNIDILKFIFKEIADGRLGRDKQLKEITDFSFGKILVSLSSSDDPDAVINLIEYLQEEHERLLYYVLLKYSSEEKRVLKSPVVREIFMEYHSSSMSDRFKSGFMEEAIMLGDIELVQLYLDKNLFDRESLDYYLGVVAEHSPNDDLEIINLLDRYKNKFRLGSVKDSQMLIPKWYHSGKRGMIKLFQYFFDKYLEFPISLTDWEQCLESKIPILQLLWEDPKYSEMIQEKHTVLCSFSFFDHCFGGDLNTIKYLVENGIINLTNFSYPNAAKFGYLDMIKYVISKRDSNIQISKPSIENFFERGFTYGNIDVVKYLFRYLDDESQSIPLEVLPQVQKLGDIHLELFKMCKSKKEDFKLAITKEILSIEGFKEAVQLELIPNMLACDEEFYFEKIFMDGDIRKYKLLESFDKFSSNWEHLLKAVSSGRIFMVKYILEKPSIIDRIYVDDWITIIARAYFGGSLELVKYLLSLPQFLTAVKNVHQSTGLATTATKNLQSILSLLFMSNDFEMVKLLVSILYDGIVENCPSFNTLQISHI